MKPKNVYYKYSSMKTKDKGAWKTATKKSQK